MFFKNDRLVKSDDDFAVLAAIAILAMRDKLRRLLPE